MTKDRGLSPAVPRHYFPDDNPEAMPLDGVAQSCQPLFTNWLNYFVYQQTPYDLQELIH